MLIDNQYGAAEINDIFSLQPESKVRRVNSAASGAIIDTVEISDEARAAYENSKTAKSGEREAIYAQFKKQFKDYRGKGVFAEDAGAEETSAPEEETQGSGEPQGVGGGSGEGENIAKIQEKIASLTSRLQAIMSSNIPDSEKQAMTGALQAQIAELKAQLDAMGA